MCHLLTCSTASVPGTTTAALAAMASGSAATSARSTPNTPALVFSVLGLLLDFSLLAQARTSAGASAASRVRGLRVFVCACGAGRSGGMAGRRQGKRHRVRGSRGQDGARQAAPVATQGAVSAQAMDRMYILYIYTYTYTVTQYGNIQYISW